MNRPNKQREQNSRYQRGRGRRAGRVKEIDGMVRDGAESFGVEPAAV